MVVPTIIPGNSVSGYEVENSVRFNDNDSPELDITYGSAGDRRTFTWSGWIKRSNISQNTTLFANGEGGTSYFKIKINDVDKLYIVTEDGSTLYRILSTQVLRDPSAWYHIVAVIDTTDDTAGNRLRQYINGVEVTAFDIEAQPSQDYQTLMNTASKHDIGYAHYSGSEFLDGYMAEIHFIDGAAKAPTDFGEVDDNGVWIPKKYSGSYGTNGFYLEFKQTGTSANSSGIGADTSGNDNHFAVTNLAATDVTTDTCTNNFCTLNSVDIDSTLPTLAEGNLDYHSANGTAFNPVRSTMAVTKGKWYAEWKYINTAGFLGVITTQSPLTGNIVSDANVRSILRIPAGLYAGRNNSAGFTDVGDNSQTFSDNDIGQVALDMDNGYVYFGINGTYLKGNDGSTTGNPAGNNGSAGGSANHVTQLMTDQHDGVIAFMAGDYTQNTTGQIQCNFGNPPYAISSGNTDGEGYGNFEFAPPSGFFALCTKNLAKYG